MFFYSRQKKYHVFRLTKMFFIPLRLKEYIELALKEHLSPANNIFDRVSRHYKIDSTLGSVQGNIIFNNMDTLPKDLTLGSSMKLFDDYTDIFEVLFQFKICNKNAIYKEFQTIQISTSRLELKEMDLNQQSKPFLGRRVSSPSPFPNSCSWQATKPPCSERFWKRLLQKTE